MSFDSEIHTRNLNPPPNVQSAKGAIDVLMSEVGAEPVGNREHVIHLTAGDRSYLLESADGRVSAA